MSIGSSVQALRANLVQPDERVVAVVRPGFWAVVQSVVKILVQDVRKEGLYKEAAFEY